MKLNYIGSRALGKTLQKSWIKKSNGNCREGMMPVEVLTREEVERLVREMAARELEYLRDLMAELSLR